MNKTDILLIGGAVALAGAAVVILKKRTSAKGPGDRLQATFRFQHRGPGGRWEVGVGLAPAAKSILGGASFYGHNPIEVPLYDVVEIENHDEPTLVEITLDFEWPNLMPGKYDALAFIQKPGGPHNSDGTGYKRASKWQDDVLTGV